MIQIEEVKKVPGEVFHQLSPFAEQEFTQWGGALPSVEHVSSMWVVRDGEGEPLLVLGAARPSLMGDVVLWMFGCQRLVGHLMVLRELRKAFPLLLVRYPSVRAKIFKTHESGVAFVKFFGFSFVEEDGEFLIFEASR